MIRRWVAAAFVVLLLALTGHAADIRLEKVTGFPSGIPKALSDSLQSAGYRVLGSDGAPVATIWLRSEIPVFDRKEVEGANYPRLTPSELVGVIQFVEAGKDFRGQSIKAGFYTLRYELLPSDGNHLGVAPDRDFLLLVAAADDPGPNTLPKYDELIKLSSLAAGTTHPACFSMVAAPKAVPAIYTDPNAYFVFAAPGKTTRGELPLAFVLKGVSMSS